MKKIKYLILWLLLSIVWLSSFSSAWSVVYTWNYWYIISSSSIVNSSSVFSLPIPSIISSSNVASSDYVNLTCNFSNVSWVPYSFNTSNFNISLFYQSHTYSYWNFTFKRFSSNNIYHLFSWFSVDIPIKWYFYINSDLSYKSLYLSILPVSNFSVDCSSSSVCVVNFDYSCTYSSDYILWSSSSDCSTIESELSQCQSDLTTCQNSSSSPSCDTTDTVSSLIEDNIIYSWQVALNWTNYVTMFDYNSDNKWEWTYCVNITNVWSVSQFQMWFTDSSTWTPTNLYSLYNNQAWQWICLFWNKRYFRIKPNSSSNISLTYQVYKLSDLYSDSVCINNEISWNDCSEVESQLWSCQWDLSTCEDDNESLTNMNQSLSDELTSCLESWWWGCNPEVDTGCVAWAVVPLLSWSVWLDSFSTPIINNLTLPTNYKWKIDDWVLTISSINQNLSIDDSDYWNIKDSFVNIVLYIFGVGLMLILVYYVKFYFFNIKD